MAKKYGLGVVVGKFYPPHLGHKFLIDTAMAQTEHLVVMVCQRDSYQISGELRAEWLRKIHPGVEVRVIEDIGKDDDSKAWAEYTIQLLGRAPDVVFTSEAYGDPWAHYMGCAHVLVDMARAKVDISATLVRKNPYEYWEFLHTVVRSYFTKRICLVGAESTGKTTLAKALAQNYQTPWVPEFGRLYSEGRLWVPAIWEDGEFEYIAGVQNAMEDRLALVANKIMFCDTNAFATTIWQERYLTRMTDGVRNLTKDRRYDLYILTDIDVPYEQDGTRENEHLRPGMHQRFIEELEKQDVPYILLSGDLQHRLDNVIKICDEMLEDFVPLTL